MRKVIYKLSLLLIVTSCANVYSPQTRYTPLFKKAGEVQGAAQLQQPLVLGEEDRIDFNVQAAVAVTNHLALMSNFAYAKVDRGTLFGHYDYYHNYYEGAVGYYTNRKSFTYEVFLGYGQGDGNTLVYDDKYSHTSQGNYTRYFIQPAVGFTLKSFQFAFTPRVSLLNFTGVTYDDKPITTGLSNKISVEPAVTARFNFLRNRLFCMAQFGLGICGFDDDNYPTNLYNPFSLSFGVGFRLGGVGWKIDEQ